MQKNKIFFIISLAIAVAIAMVVISRIKTIDLKPEQEAIKAVMEFQKAIRDKDAEKVSAFVYKKMQPDYTKKTAEEWFNKFPQHIELYGTASLKKAILINPARIWVKCDSSIGELKGFYMVKEGRKWKYGHLPVYIDKVKNDIEFINTGIKNYYSTEGNLPYELSDLTPRYVESLPLDPFSDGEKPYNYELLGPQQWKIYSIGVDGRNDFGLIKYDIDGSIIGLYTKDFGTGDIVMEISIN